MAEKDEFEDEYQFTDADALGPDNYDETELGPSTEQGTVEHKKPLADTNIRRNALIAVAFVILAMFVYKFLGSYFSDTKKATTNDLASKAPKPMATQPKPKTVPVQPQSLNPPPAPVQPTAQLSSEVSDKLSSLESSQENIQNEVSGLSGQLGGVNDNLSELSSQLNNLNQAISSLNDKLDSQARDIDSLKAQVHKARKKVHHHVSKPSTPKRYYLKAVIPGRAWLIAPNGSTLTVSTGSNIPGYGTVKLIDPHQGSIVTSSGQIIRFSQADS